MARSLTTRSTNPKIMDDNIKILDDNLGKASAPDAEDVVYDNTDSGLAANDVQSAIDEISATRKVVVTSLPEDVSSLELNSNLEFSITEDLNGYALTGFVVVTTYGHKTTIMSRFLEYALVIGQSSTSLVCQILTKTFSIAYNGGTVYLIFDKVS